MPDRPIKKRNFCWAADEPSLRDFLKKYVDFLKEDIDKFYKEENAYYTYSVLYKGDIKWRNHDKIFTSLKSCEEGLRQKTDKAELYSIKKSAPNADKYIEATFFSNGEIQDIYAIDPNDISDEKADYMLRFEGLWFAIPTPFKRGDILYMPRRFEKSRPFTLLYMSSWDENEMRQNGFTEEEIVRFNRLFLHHKEFGDETDMIACGYYTDEHGRVYRENVMGNYLDLEYYDGEIDGENVIF